jgi:hypothetical protein
MHDTHMITAAMAKSRFEDIVPRVFVNRSPIDLPIMPGRCQGVNLATQATAVLTKQGSMNPVQPGSLKSHINI